MPDQLPVLIKPIPPQVVNEGAAFGPLNLNDFIKLSEGETGSLQFYAELTDGRSLTQGLICTESGTLGGIPATGTEGFYEVVIHAKSPSGVELAAEVQLTVKERISMLEGHQYFTDLKAKIWEALGENSPLPEIESLLDRPLTLVEVYYLIQRFATMTIWDVHNLDLPGENVKLQVEGASPHFQIYDRGSCLVGAPVDLFSHERTLEDALQTARVMAREAYKRGWTVELTGFNKMVRATWVEIQLLAAKHGKPLEVLHYEPTEADQKLYLAEEQARLRSGSSKSS